MMNVSKFNFNPTAMGEQSANCEFLSSDLEPLRAPLNLSKDKLLGNNSLAKKFSETFSKDLNLHLYHVFVSFVSSQHLIKANLVIQNNKQ